MVDSLFFFIINYNYLLVILLFVVKLFYFLSHSRNWKISHFFYFRFFNVFDTDDFKVQAQKKFQNKLSITILFLFLFQILIVYYKSWY